MKGEKRSIVLLIVLIAAFAVMFNGCKGKSVDVNMEVGDATGNVTGKVIDPQTLQGIGGAEVTLMVNGKKKKTRTSTSTDSDVLGTFRFGKVPATDCCCDEDWEDNLLGHKLTVEVDGYAIYTEFVCVPMTYDNTPVTVNLGDILLTLPCEVTVMVSDNGTPVAGAPVVAVPSDYYEYDSDGPFGDDNWCGYTQCSGSDYITAVTGEDGTATLEGLSQCCFYYVVVPAFDADDDGQIDYQTSIFYGDYDMYTCLFGDTISIALWEVQPGDDLDRITTNLYNREQLDRYYSRNIPGAVTEGEDCYVRASGPNDPIIMVYNYPVTLAPGFEPICAEYVRNLVDPADENFGELIDLGATFALDSTGIILTITPPTAGFPPNELIDLNGGVKTNIWGSTEFSDFSYEVYVEPVNDAPTLTADNYNGGTGTGAVYLELPEIFEGDYRIVSYTIGDTTTEGSETRYGLNSCYYNYGEVIYDDGETRASAGVVYRVMLTGVPAMADHTAETPSTVTIAVDGWDASNNHYYTDALTLQVQ